MNIEEDQKTTIVISEESSSSNDDNKTESAKGIFSRMDPLERATHIVYLCQALSFLFGISAIVGIVINYIRRDEVKGSWLESHFTWQIKTFWISVFSYIIGFILMFIFVGFIVWGVTFIWSIYRVIKGWLLLSEGKSIPVVLKNRVL